MKIIEEIEVKNFRSFGNRKQETVKILKLNDLNIFSGANDSGKSNILRALNLFFNSKTNLNDNFSFDSDYCKKNKDEKDVKEELDEITKPTIYTEGNNKEYLKIAKELFGSKKDYDIKDAGGKNGLKNFFTSFI